MRRVRRSIAVALAGLLLGRGVGVARAGGSERALGRQFILEARGQLPLLDDPMPQEFVDRLGQRTVKSLGPQEFDYHFYVVDHPALNAFAVPGGYVFIFSGLLARAQSDDELAGVLAHEIGHVHAHHVTRMQQQGQVWTAASLLGLLLSVVNPVLGAAALAAAQTAQLAYSRDFEQEADYLGLRYMQQVGFDPRGMAGFFKHILAEQRLNPAGVPAYMLTHPLSEERVSKIYAAIETQKLRTPSGRPQASLDLLEAQAVSRAVAGPTETVLAEYRRAADAEPKNPERQFLSGRVAQVVGQLDAARQAFERCRDLGGIGGRVDRPLGIVYAGLKRTDDARAAFERSLAKRPDDAPSRLELGRVLEAVGDEAGALREYQRAVELDTELDEAQRLMGLALGRRGQEADGLYHLALSARLRGDLAQALSHFEKTEELLAASSPRRDEVEDAIIELRPIVSGQQREEAERRRRRRAWAQAAPGGAITGLPNPRAGRSGL